MNLVFQILKFFLLIVLQGLNHFFLILIYWLKKLVFWKYISVEVFTLCFEFRVFSLEHLKWVLKGFSRTCHCVKIVCGALKIHFSILLQASNSCKFHFCFRMDFLLMLVFVYPHFSGIFFCSQKLLKVFIFIYKLTSLYISLFSHRFFLDTQFVKLFFNFLKSFFGSFKTYSLLLNLLYVLLKFWWKQLIFLYFLSELLLFLIFDVIQNIEICQ